TFVAFQIRDCYVSLPHILIHMPFGIPFGLFLTLLALIVEMRDSSETTVIYVIR
ncbi:hypothetical protein L9F63_023681, partial [Diploptera punctata]